MGERKSLTQYSSALKVARAAREQSRLDSSPSLPPCDSLIGEFSIGHLVRRSLSYLKEK